MEVVAAATHTKDDAVAAASSMIGDVTDVAGTVAVDIDAYQEGEEESSIKVEIVAALNLWLSEASEQKSKVGFSIKFPGAPADQKADELQTAEIVGYLPDEEPKPKGFPCTPSSAPPPPPLPNPESGATTTSPPVPPKPANFTMGTTPLVREFERLPEYLLCHKLLQENMVILLYWISASGTAKTILGMTTVDLAGLLSLNGNSLDILSPVIAYVEPPAAEATTPAAGAKKGAKAAPAAPPVKKAAAPPEKGKKGGPAAAPIAPIVEVTPALLPEAKLKIKMSTSIPLLSDIDQKEGFVMEIGPIIVRNLPPKVKDFGTAEAAPDPFAYSCGFSIPGMSGKWWESLTCFETAEKTDLAIFKAASGAVEMEEVTYSKEREPPVDKAAGPRELKTLLFGENLKNPFPKPKPFMDEYGYPPAPEVIKEMRAVIRWKESVRRFLPSAGANELRAKIKKKIQFKGELARYVKQESFDMFSDPYFKRYHSSFQLDLLIFQEKEGLKETTVACPLQDNATPDDAMAGGEPSICPPDTRAPSKKVKAIEDDVDPPPPTAVTLAKSKVDPKAKIEAQAALQWPNAWKTADSVIFVTIKTSLPIEPVWKAPPEPELQLKDVIPPRLKAPNIYDTLKIAMEKFREFVVIAATDISLLHQRVVGGEVFEETIAATEQQSTNKSRIESKAEIRKQVAQELRQSGAWQQMREEMKSRVFKVASEKFKTGKKDAMTSGKFEFCNALYVELMEEIHASLADLFFKRQRASLPLGSTDEKLSSPQEKKLFLLRKLADEYEYDGDYRSANRLHQERLLGKMVHDPDIWFEYGCYCMRVKDNAGRPKDQGKAEECFREALTLDNNHLLSLLALGSLMWHRNYLTKAEVLLRSAIELHPEQEFIAWCILSRIHQVQGQKENMNSCLKKTELLYKSARETHNLYSTPHILTSSLLKFPFSAAYLFLKEMGEPSTALIATSLLLLDLHLPKEAIHILELECDMFSTAFDNKWAQAKANELLMDYKLGEVWLRENLSITKDEPMSWLLMGHNRYISGQFAEALEAYEQHLRYQGKKAIYPYVHLDMGNCHLQLKNYKAAKEVFLKACTTCPTVSTWLGAGIAFFRMREFKQAEIALVEGNHIDNKNQKVWAYLTLICLALERFNEAETAFQQMQKLELTNVTLLLEIADAFGKVGNYRDMEVAIMAALKEEQGRVSAGFKLAELFLHQGKLECSKIEYEKILELDNITSIERKFADSKVVEIQTLAFEANQPVSARRVTVRHIL